ncbi:MAG: type II 3-dehydroquinate dehydratase [Lachnospiraceae bacterium]|nr:type II 3-dehydroquinate dehydratase [Lachnospiraceae bacterium]
MKILVINGPNLNMLGKRDKAQYSARTYAELLDMISKKADEMKVTVDFYQSNHEGAIIDRLQLAMEDGTDAIIINAGAYTHYSYAIHDALEIINMPKIEVHISNIYEREAFRAHSVITEVCSHSIVGEGFEGYLHAMEVIKEALGE